nr:MAG TPA: hypothetical protein [Caudoviricetes sp.]
MRGFATQIAYNKKGYLQRSSPNKYNIIQSYLLSFKRCKDTIYY